MHRQQSRQGVPGSRLTATALGTAVVLAFTVLTGCGRPAGAGPAEPPRELTDAEQVRIDQAELRLVQRCMEKKGFRYWVEPALSPEEGKAFRTGFVADDVAWARKHGYGSRIQDKVLAAKKDDRNLSYRERLSRPELRRYLTALGGGESARILSVRLPAGGTIRGSFGGCTGEARKALYKDLDTWFRAEKTVGNLNPLYVPRLVRDTRFTGALKAWSACMRRETGRTYPEPDRVRASLPGLTKGLSPGRAHSVEKKLAVAEAACADGAALPGTIRLLVREYGADARARYADEIITRDRLRLAALARADRIPGPNG
ncbi:hypothetical protein ACWDR0_15875 [Streptomyces sp. NPDC003691]